MRVLLVHHADALTLEQDPVRHLSPRGREQADRLGARLRALGIRPARILHSDKMWTIETAQRIAAQLGVPDHAAQAGYAINTGDAVAPFLAEIAASQGDIMMCGHIDFLLRSAAALVSGNEAKRVVEFKPGNGTLAWLEGAGKDWVVTTVWRQDHPPG